MNENIRRIPALIAMTLLVTAFALIAGGTGIVEAQLIEPTKVAPAAGNLNVQTLIDKGNAPGLMALLQQHQASLSAPAPKGSQTTSIFNQALQLGIVDGTKRSPSMGLALKAAQGDENTLLQSMSKTEIEALVKIGLRHLTGLNPPAEGIVANAIKLGASPQVTDTPRQQYEGDPDPSQPVGDWRIPRIVMLVKDSGRADLDQRNQGRGFNGAQYQKETACGCCWAFGTAGAFEQSYAVRYNKYINISEQDILNNADPNFGCNGGWWAFDYLKSSGVSSEIDSRYLGAKLVSAVPKPRFKVTQWGYVSSASDVPDKQLIKNALCQYGPLAVGVNATPAFSNYPGGVFSENDPGITNHAVLLVGWNDNLGGGCWVIRNSWGGNWGEDGFMNITYGSNKIGFGAAWVVPEESPAP